MINSINGGAVRRGVRAHTPLQDQPVNKHFVVQALSDVLSQFPGHLHGVDEVRGIFQDGVVGHEVVGADPRVVGIQVDCRAVGCVATAAALGRGEEGVRGRKKHTGERRVRSGAIPLPFSTLDVGVVRQKHGQEVHEVLSLWPLLATGRHRPAVYAGGIHNWKGKRLR